MDMVSCMDCSHEFWNDDYQQHIKCISEEEKYSGKDYKPRPGQNKGELKQDAWLQQVQKAIDSSSSTPKVRHLLERLKDYPNIPRKQAKFLNFIKNSMRISDTKLANSVWDILMPVTQPKDKVNEKENDKNETNSEKDKCEKNKTEEEEEEEEDSTKKVKKMSKREKKEERRKEQSKDEKKDKKQNHASEKVDNDEKNEEIGGRLPAKKKGKKRKRNDSSSAEDEDKNNVVLGEKNGEKTKPKKKSDKKRRHAEKDDDDDLPPLEANPNHACFEETQDDDEEKDSPPKKKKSKNFNWEQIILSLLQKAKEKTMSEKKLRKKVLAEYVSQGGHVDSMSILKAKFDRKIKKNRQFVRQKDTVRLIDE